MQCTARAKVVKARNSVTFPTPHQARQCRIVKQPDTSRQNTQGHRAKALGNRLPQGHPLPR